MEKTSEILLAVISLFTQITSKEKNIEQLSLLLEQCYLPMVNVVLHKEVISDINEAKNIQKELKEILKNKEIDLLVPIPLKIYVEKMTDINDNFVTYRNMRNWLLREFVYAKKKTGCPNMSFGEFESKYYGTSVLLNLTLVFLLFWISITIALIIYSSKSNLLQAVFGSLYIVLTAFTLVFLCTTLAHSKFSEPIKKKKNQIVSWTKRNVTKKNATKIIDLTKSNTTKIIDSTKIGAIKVIAAEKKKVNSFLTLKKRKAKRLYTLEKHKAKKSIASEKRKAKRIVANAKRRRNQ